MIFTGVPVDLERIAVVVVCRQHRDVEYMTSAACSQLHYLNCSSASRVVERGKGMENNTLRVGRNEAETPAYLHRRGQGAIQSALRVTRNTGQTRAWAR